MCQAFGGIRGGSRYDEDARVHDAVGHLDVDVSAPAGVELVPVTDARRVSALVDVHDEVFGGDHAAIGSAITAALAAQLRPVEAVVAVAGDTAISAGTDAACLIDIHLKRTSYEQAFRSGRLSLEGPPQLTTAFTSWIRPSPYADIVPARQPAGS